MSSGLDRGAGGSAPSKVPGREAAETAPLGHNYASATQEGPVGPQGHRSPSKEEGKSATAEWTEGHGYSGTQAPAEMTYQERRRWAQRAFERAQGAGFAKALGDWIGEQRWQLWFTGTFAKNVCSLVVAERTWRKFCLRLAN